LAYAGTHPVFNTNDSGIGSLRQAIINANGDPAPPVIVDAGTISGTITLSNGQLPITNGMSIQGPGSDKLTIDGSNSSRIFYVNTSSAQSVLISGVSITHGNSTGGGGGVLGLQASLTLEDCVVDSNKTYVNTAVIPTIPGNGGGISASGATLLLSRVTLSNNYASGIGGGAFLYPGNGGTSYFRDSIISNNTAGGSVGGVYNGQGSAYLVRTRVLNNHTPGKGPGGGVASIGTGQNTDILDSTISGNTTNGSGGGLFIKSTSGSVYMNRTLVSANSGGAADDHYGSYFGGGAYISTSSASIMNSTISANSGGFGGGLFFYRANPATISNTTIVGNRASFLTGRGGGVYSLPVVTVESSTIAENSAYSGGGVTAIISGAILHNAVIANNALSTQPLAHDPDTQGYFYARFSLIRTPGDAAFAGASSNNITGVDPLLGSLGNYGGPMPTKLPLSGSPLIDAGDPGTSPLTTDQRGLARVVGAAIDIGADERQTSEDTIFLDAFEGY
jgi:hypothetical protein